MNAPPKARPGDWVGLVVLRLQSKWPELVRKIKEMGLGVKGYSDMDGRSIQAVTVTTQGRFA